MHPSDNYHIRKARQAAKGPVSYRRRMIKHIPILRSKAAKRGHDCDITIDDLKLNEICPVLGIPLSYDGPRDTTPSIDRIDNTKGYVKGNVRVVSQRANRFKNEMTLEEAKAIVDHWFDI